MFITFLVTSFVSISSCHSPLPFHNAIYLFLLTQRFCITPFRRRSNFLRHLSSIFVDIIFCRNCYCYFSLPLVIATSRHGLSGLFLVAVSINISCHHPYRNFSSPFLLAFLVSTLLCRLSSSLCLSNSVSFSRRHSSSQFFAVLSCRHISWPHFSLILIYVSFHHFLSQSSTRTSRRHFSSTFPDAISCCGSSSPFLIATSLHHFSVPFVVSISSCPCNRHLSSPFVIAAFCHHLELSFQLPFLVSTSSSHISAP